MSEVVPTPVLSRGRNAIPIRWMTVPRFSVCRLNCCSAYAYAPMVLGKVNVAEPLPVIVLVWMAIDTASSGQANWAMTDIVVVLSAQM
jgi:hypothetical protein